MRERLSLSHSLVVCFACSLSLPAAFHHIHTSACLPSLVGWFVAYPANDDDCDDDDCDDDDCDDDDCDDDDCDCDCQHISDGGTHAFDCDCDCDSDCDCDCDDSDDCDDCDCDGDNDNDANISAMAALLPLWWTRPAPPTRARNTWPFSPRLGVGDDVQRLRDTASPIDPVTPGRRRFIQRTSGRGKAFAPCSQVFEQVCVRECETRHRLFF